MARRNFPWGKVIFFATGNLHKYNEAQRVLAEHGMAAAMLRMDTLEIQNDDIEIIARAAALDAARKTSLPVIVEDAGLFIDALHGFPGPYSKYVYQTLGKAGVVKLLEGQHPQTVGIAATAGHWAKGRPIAKGKGTNFDKLLPFDFEHVDPVCGNIETSVRVKVRRIEG